MSSFVPGWSGRYRVFSPLPETLRCGTPRRACLKSLTRKIEWRGILRTIWRVGRPAKWPRPVRRSGPPGASGVRQTIDERSASKCPAILETGQHGCRTRKRTGGSPRQRSLCELRHLVFKKRRHLIFKMTARGDRTLHHRCHVRSRRSPEKLPFTGNALELDNSACSILLVWTASNGIKRARMRSL